MGYRHKKLIYKYICILDNQLSCSNLEASVYLCLGAEAPFLAEHIIDIDTPSQEHSDW